MAKLYGQTVQTGLRKDEEKTVELEMGNGNQAILPSPGKALSKVIISKPATLQPENIRQGFSIGGVSGTMPYTAISTREVIITSNGSFEFTPPEGYAYSKLTATINIGGGSGEGHTVSFAENWNTYGSDRMGTITFTFADGSTETNNNTVDLNGSSKANIISVAFTETEGESWLISYEMGNQSDNIMLSTGATEVLTLTDDIIFEFFTK